MLETFNNPPTRLKYKVSNFSIRLWEMVNNLILSLSLSLSLLSAYDKFWCHIWQIPLKFSVGLLFTSTVLQ